MISILLFLLSFLAFSSALECEYFDPKTQPENCDVTISQYSHAHIDQIELEIFKSYLSNSSLSSFHLLYQNTLVLSTGVTSHLNAILSLRQTFLLSIASIILSDSSYSAYGPFSSTLSRLTPFLQLDSVQLDTYLCDIMSLQIFDPINDQYWYGPNITVELAQKAFPIIERFLEEYFGDSLRHLIQKTGNVLGLDTFRLDQTNDGNKLLRSTTKDVLRMANIVKSLMNSEFSNFSSVYSHFPLQSEELKRAFKEFKFGWWINGAPFHGDNSNLIKVAPGDTIGSLECTNTLYITPSWDMVILIQRSPKSCENNFDWMAEDRNIWAQLSKVYTGKDEDILSRYSLGFTTSGVNIIKNFMFYTLYCIVGHVLTTYVTKLFWDFSCMLSSKTKFKHT